MYISRKTNHSSRLIQCSTLSSPKQNNPRNRRLRQRPLGGPTRRGPHRPHRIHRRLQLLPHRTTLRHHRRLFLPRRLGKNRRSLHGLDPRRLVRRQDFLRHFGLQHGVGRYLQRPVYHAGEERRSRSFVGGVDAGGVVAPVSSQEFVVVGTVQFGGDRWNVVYRRGDGRSFLRRELRRAEFEICVGCGRVAAAGDRG